MVTSCAQQRRMLNGHGSHGELFFMLGKLVVSADMKIGAPDFGDKLI